MTEKKRRKPHGPKAPPVIARIAEQNKRQMLNYKAAARGKTTRSKHFHLKLTPELAKLARDKAEALGISFNHFLELAALAYLDHIEKGEATK